MKKYYFAFLILITFSLSIKAQSCNQHPAYGDSLIGISTSYDTTGFNTGPTGSGVTWNYASLVVDTTGIISHHYFDPATTPGTSSFPGANLADLTPVGQYTYTMYAADSITSLGIWSVPLGCTTQLFYDPQSLHCPFTFGSSFTDSYRDYGCGAGAYTHSKGTKINTFDGTGTLILPTITYNNVNRIKITDTAVDSSFTSNGTFSGTVSTITKIYLWMDVNTNQSVFGMIDYYSITYNFKYRSIGWSNYSHIPGMITTDIKSAVEDKSKITIYPNPFNSSTLIQLNSTIKNGELTIFNAFGQKVRTINNISGDQIKIERDNLSKGVYFARLTQEGKIITTNKLIIID